MLGEQHFQPELEGRCAFSPQGVSVWEPPRTFALIEAHGTREHPESKRALTQGSPDASTPTKCLGTQRFWSPFARAPSRTALLRLLLKALRHRTRAPGCGTLPSRSSRRKLSSACLGHCPLPQGSWVWILDGTGPRRKVGSPTEPSLWRPPRSGSVAQWPSEWLGVALPCQSHLWVPLRSSLCSGQRGAEPHLGLTPEQCEARPHASDVPRFPGCPWVPAWSESVPSSVAGCSHGQQLNTWPVHTEEHR